MTRRLAAAITGLALSISVLPVVAAPSASAALSSGVAFTGADLPTWQTDGIVWASAAAGGKVFVGGDFSAVRAPGTSVGDASSLTRTNLAVLDGATGAPLDCAPAVTGSENASVRALEVSPDGETLYIGGSFTAVGSATGRKHLAALDISSCTPVAGFAPQPSAPLRAVEATGSAVYFGGLMGFVGTEARARAAAVAAVGAPQAGSLLPWDPQFDGELRAIAVRPGGSEVVVGGLFDTVNGAASHALAVVDPVGGDTLFSYPTLVPGNSVVKDIAVDSSGFYTAHEGSGTGQFDGRIALDWSSHGQRWRDTCAGATQAVVVYAGVLYSGSHVHDCTSMGSFPDGLRYHLVAQSVTDPTLLPWFPQTNDGLGEALGPRDMVVSDGAVDVLWVVGEFTTVDGEPQQGLTRFGQSAGTQASPSSPTPSVTSVRAGEVRVAWRQSFDADDATLTYEVFRDGQSVHTATGTSWFWERKQMTFVDTGLAPGSSPSYTISVSDGNRTVTTTGRRVTVASQDSAYADRVVADGATGFWRYDEPGGVLFADTSAADYNLTLTGGTADYRVTPGALTGDASPAMSVPGTKATLYGERRLAAPGAFSVETWFKTTTTAGGKLIGFGDKQVLPSRNFDRHVYMTDDGRLVFGVDTGSRVTLTTPQAYNDGTWHHVVATQGSAGMALYVDGVKISSNRTTSAMKVAGYWRVAGDNISCRVTTCGGRVWPNAPTSDHFGGQLDETAVYASALSAETVAAHHALAAEGTSVPADVAPPSVPQGVSASVSASTVTVSWSPASDEVGVTAYELHRLASSGSTPTASSRVATVTGTSASEAAVPAGTWYYRVVATDAAGNRSGASSPASATVAAPADAGSEPTPVVPPVAPPVAPPAPEAPSTPSQPDARVTERLAGADRYATAVAIVRDAFPAGPVPVVFIATGSAFADALAAGPAADALGGPVLPVRKDGVPADVRGELTRLQPARIVVLGGSNAISDAVVAELRTLTPGTVSRLAGVDRYATAAQVATTSFSAPVRQVLVATGATFADALAGGAVGAHTDSPVLLVSRTSVPAETAAALQALRPRDITVLGGTAAVSDSVLQGLGRYAVGGTVTRVAGADRAATAAALAQVFWPQTADTVYLATGSTFPDALSGVPAAGRDGAPLLLVNPTCMPASTKRELDRLDPTSVVVLGGEASVTRSAAEGAVCGSAQ